MRRNIGVAAVALGVGAGLWALPMASADHGDDGRGNDGRSKGFTVTVQEVDSVELDLGETGFGLGDRFVFTEDLYMRGKRVGSDHGECVLTRLIEEGQSGTFHCNVTAIFDRWGQITVQGAFDFSENEEGEPFRLAVTGGTGKFRDAGGEVIVDETGEDSLLTFKLTS